MIVKNVLQYLSITAHNPLCSYLVLSYSFPSLLNRQMEFGIATFVARCILKTAHDPDMIPAMDEQPIYHLTKFKTELKINNVKCDGQKSKNKKCDRQSVQLLLFLAIRSECYYDSSYVCDGQSKL